MEGHRCSPTRSICAVWEQMYSQIQKCGYVCINNVLYGQYNGGDNTLVVPLQPRNDDDQTKKDLEKVVISSKVKEMVLRASPESPPSLSLVSCGDCGED